MWYKNKVVASPGETIYEIVTAEDGQSFGIAVAEIRESKAHYHDYITEVYTVLEGEVEVTIDGKTQVMTNGDTITIRPGPVHSARRTLPSIESSVVVVGPVEQATASTAAASPATFRISLHMTLASLFLGCVGFRF